MTYYDNNIGGMEEIIICYADFSIGIQYQVDRKYVLPMNHCQQVSLAWMSIDLHHLKKFSVILVFGQQQVAKKEKVAAHTPYEAIHVCVVCHSFPTPLSSPLSLFSTLEQGTESLGISPSQYSIAVKRRREEIKRSTEREPEKQVITHQPVQSVSTYSLLKGSIIHFICPL